MAALQLTPSTLTLHLSRAEKILGLLRNVQVPLAAVRSAEVVSDPLSAVRGLRAPGMALPGLRKIGTWRRQGERVLVSIRRGQPAVRVRLNGQRYDELMIGTDDAAAVAGELTAAVSGAS
jgi:hypothetical protein